MRVYKQLSNCLMCKQRFVVENPKIRARNYCPECKNKYFEMKKEIV
ncbi:hypothetical protein HOD20_05530 [archaeon]|nr:hypothetical protein [archaeon]MBT4646687.1 hypothetical protein [archaeon]MBT6821863.1 hypothetical protein [archaeon]MBT7392273.1 hypothetical protein [archaeon]